MSDDLEFRAGRIAIKAIAGSGLPIAEMAMKAHLVRLSFADDKILASGPDAGFAYDRRGGAASERQRRGIFYPILAHMSDMPVVELDPKADRISFLGSGRRPGLRHDDQPNDRPGSARGGTAQGHWHPFLRTFPMCAKGHLLGASLHDVRIH
jgi:hypothetical protein